MFTKELKYIKGLIRDDLEDLRIILEDQEYTGDATEESIKEDIATAEKILEFIEEYEAVPMGAIWDCPYCEEETIKRK